MIAFVKGSVGTYPGSWLDPWRIIRSSPTCPSFVCAYVFRAVYQSSSVYSWAPDAGTGLVAEARNPVTHREASVVSPFAAAAHLPAPESVSSRNSSSHRSSLSASDYGAQSSAPGESLQCMRPSSCHSLEPLSGLSFYRQSLTLTRAFLASGPSVQMPKSTHCVAAKDSQQPLACKNSVSDVLT